jgi:hypothetical protein
VEALGQIIQKLGRALGIFDILLEFLLCAELAVAGEQKELIFIGAQHDMAHFFCEPFARTIKTGRGSESGNCHSGLCDGE